MRETAWPWDRQVDVVAALHDTRINEVTSTINSRGATLADAIAAKSCQEIDGVLGNRAVRSQRHALVMPRIGQLRELLIGGLTENVTQQLETRGRAAADALRKPHQSGYRNRSRGQERCRCRRSVLLTGTLRQPSRSIADGTLDGYGGTFDEWILPWWRAAPHRPFDSAAAVNTGDNAPSWRVDMITDRCQQGCRTRRRR